jgi:hypothetical protein
MIKRILIVLFSICILTASVKADDSIDDQTGANYTDPDTVNETDVPFDDYVPFLVAGIVVYGVWMNRQKKTVQA